MKKKLIKIILSKVTILAFSTSVFAGMENRIRFVMKSETQHSVSANCGNFSYPGGWRHLSNELAYTIQPAGLIGNPRQLEYTCSIRVSGFSGKDILTFYPSDFNHAQSNSEVVLTIHSVDKKTKCGGIRLTNNPPQALLLFSLSIDGRLLEDRRAHCFY